MSVLCKRNILHVFFFDAADLWRLNWLYKTDAHLVAFLFFLNRVVVKVTLVHQKSISGFWSICQTDCYFFAVPQNSLSLTSEWLSYSVLSRKESPFGVLSLCMVFDINKLWLPSVSIAFAKLVLQSIDLAGIVLLLSLMMFISETAGNYSRDSASSVLS